MRVSKTLETYGRCVSGPRGKWITLLLWIVVAGVLNALLPTVNSQENNNAANLPESFPSVQAEQVAKREFPNADGVPGLLVWYRSGGLTDDDLKIVQKLADTFTANPLPEQTALPPYHQMPLPALKAQLSADKLSLVTPIVFSQAAESDLLKENFKKLEETITAQAGYDPFTEEVASSKLIVRVTGPAGISVDAVALFKNADVSLLIATVLLVLVLLLAIYRSPILAFIPLIAVGFAYGVSGPILGWMAKMGWIEVDSQAISIMTVLLFGAGTDYCLFLVARFRQLLTEEANKWTALKRAISGSSGAIAMSGFTVVLALAALLLADYGAIHRFAVPFSLAILIMAIASLTLVPALLAILGRGSFYPFVPRTPEMVRERAEKKGVPVKEQSSRTTLGARFADVVVRKPWTVIVVTLVVLIGAASFAPKINYTYDLLSSFPKTMPSREGFDLIAKSFSPGSLAPVQVMADTEGKSADLQGALSKLSFVDEVSAPQKGKMNANIVSVDVKLHANPYSNEAMGYIADIRAAAEAALTGSGVASAVDRVWVGGQTAQQYDTKRATERDERLIIPVVIGLIALLLLAYLRSFVAMLYLIATVVLSYGSALGLGWIVLHYFMGADAVAGAIPLYAFVFLVALGEDYNIFMISSIWKKRAQMPLKEAIREGVCETGGVITSAGLILAGTFAVLATLPIQVLLQFGIITAIGVLLDTFIVRPFLVPAITTVLGRFAFWPGAASRKEASGKPEHAV
ncbi:MMPL family transporter [Paenibacillus ginsengarvi]|uniref:MMPL family transporter n=1 Tax=Paenibacillus ginsengarvi TaxID=400777 RepID=A0A3B0CJF5_9BACL|nr:MMPL family transporter [Paenibacillus ginsengarvi]RKN84971.1 MMPL family transporter [Paenibacillus ginsengarvi]